MNVNTGLFQKAGMLMTLEYQIAQLSGFADDLIDQLSDETKGLLETIITLGWVHIKDTLFKKYRLKGFGSQKILTVDLIAAGITLAFADGRKIIALPPDCSDPAVQRFLSYCLKEEFSILCSLLSEEDKIKIHDSEGESWDNVMPTWVKPGWDLYLFTFDAFKIRTK